MKNYILFLSVSLIIILASFLYIDIKLIEARQNQLPDSPFILVVDNPDDLKLNYSCKMNDFCMDIMSLDDLPKRK